MLYSWFTGAVSIDVCQSCLPGHYCAMVGLSTPSGPCNPGFYCTEESNTATPWGNTTANRLIVLALLRGINTCMATCTNSCFRNGKTPIMIIGGEPEQYCALHHFLPMLFWFYLMFSWPLTRRSRGLHRTFTISLSTIFLPGIAESASGLLVYLLT